MDTPFHVFKVKGYPFLHVFKVKIYQFFHVFKVKRYADLHVFKVKTKISDEKLCRPLYFIDRL